MCHTPCCSWASHCPTQSLRELVDAAGFRPRHTYPPRRHHHNPHHTYLHPLLFWSCHGLQELPELLDDDWRIPPPPLHPWHEGNSPEIVWQPRRVHWKVAAHKQSQQQGRGSILYQMQERYKSPPPRDKWCLTEGLHISENKRGVYRRTYQATHMCVCVCVCTFPARSTSTQ